MAKSRRTADKDRIRARGIALVILLAVPVGAALGLFFWLSADLPSTDDLTSVRPWERTVLYDIKQRPIKAFYEEDRAVVSLDEMPRELVGAFISVEDRQFYRHWGLNLFAIGKALVEDVVARKVVRGASTITQQLARNLFLTQEQTLTRKIKEAILAVRIERHYTKREILSMYLNQIYFGDGAYGVEAAARRFFGKSVSDLSLAECAMLAGLPRNPTAYSPRRHPDRARARQGIVLESMRETGDITREQAEQAAREETEILTADLAEPGAYFAEYVRQTLEDKYGASMLYREGLRVYTTLDLDLQAAAETALERNVQKLERELRYRPRDTSAKKRQPGAVSTPYIQGALLALDPHTGHIKAMVGGRDFAESNWNRAVQAQRQPGSAFKVFVYTAAVDNGLTPADMLVDDPLVIPMSDGTTWRPQNYDAEYAGPITARRALARSINVPAIKLANRVGQQTVIDYAHRMGVRSHLQPYMSIALGTLEVNMLEMVSAVGVLPAGGVRAEPMAILRIESRDGRTLERHESRKYDVLSPETAYVMNSMLASVVNEGTAGSVRARGLTQTLAGKTGTTDDYSDAWFIGYSPDLCVGTWVGFDARRRMGEKISGSRAALPIWIDFMTVALAGVPDRPFPEPAGIAHRVICQETGLIAREGCPSTRSEVFIQGTEPARLCTEHRGAQLSQD
ncbi:MAG: PBP1A family penicillin-binding protein [bacterium]